MTRFLRDVLIDAIERYEVANGEIKWPQLAGQSVEEAIEARAKQLGCWRHSE